MLYHIEGTMEERDMPIRYFNMVLVGLFFSKMLLSLSRIVMHAKGQGPYLEGMKCLLTIFWRLISLMSKEYNSWDHSYHISRTTVCVVDYVQMGRGCSSACQ